MGIGMKNREGERSSPEYEKDIIEALTWLGLHWDGPIVYQSQKLQRYQEISSQLIRQGLAYEDVEDGRKAVKFKIPQKRAVFHDLVKGEIQFDSSLFEDLVILKSDGYPTYHFACVVDDHDMEVSHVIRGEDHVSNTPRQIFLFEALGWPPPQYGHLPLILGNDGTPLSKRHGSVSLTHFRNQGYLPEAILNYLALLGWGPEGNQEFFHINELISKFSLKRVTKAGARFNIEKMKWINAQHIKKLPDQDYLDQVTSFYQEESSKISSAQWRRLALLYRNRLQTLEDLKEQADYFFVDKIEYEHELCREFFKEPALEGMIETWSKKAAALENFENEKELESITREATKANGKEAKDLIHPLRFALTGKKISPGLFEVMSLLGKEKCLRRVGDFKGTGVRHD